MRKSTKKFILTASVWTLVTAFFIFWGLYTMPEPGHKRLGILLLCVSLFGVMKLVCAFLEKFQHKSVKVNFLLNCIADIFAAIAIFVTIMDYATTGFHRDKGMDSLLYIVCGAVIVILLYFAVRNHSSYKSSH